MMRRLVGQALEGAGYRVVEAADGLLALARFRETPDVELIICDINMPHMNGIEFLQALRRAPFESAVPVVILSTPGQLDLMGQARTLGAKTWLLKPFSEPQLLETVRRVACAE